MRLIHIATAEGEDVVLPDLAPGVLEASVAQVLAGLERRCHDIASPGEES